VESKPSIWSICFILQKLNVLQNWEFRLFYFNPYQATCGKSAPIENSSILRYSFKTRYASVFTGWISVTDYSRISSSTGTIKRHSDSLIFENSCAYPIVMCVPDSPVLGCMIFISSSYFLETKNKNLILIKAASTACSVHCPTHRCITFPIPTISQALRFRCASDDCSFIRDVTMMIVFPFAWKLMEKAMMVVWEFRVQVTCWFLIARSD